MNRQSPGSALSSVLPATVLASILGLAVQVLVPLVRPAADYVDFNLFWSTLFFCVAAGSGVQQELSRAARSGSGVTPRRELGRFAVGTTAVAVVVAAAVAVTVCLVALPESAVAFAVWVIVGVAAYVVLATAVGTLFGAERWRGAAAGMVADPFVRAVIFAAVAVGVGVWSFAPSTAALYAATAVPFVIAAAALWAVAVRAPGFSLTADPRTLWRNTTHTVVAAAALGLVSIGLPLLVRLAASDISTSALAGALLVVTLARAPLVSPALALQSYLTVSLRTAASRGRVPRLVLAVVVVGVVLAALAIWLVPPVMAALVPDYGVPSAMFIGVVVGSSALVAAQCVTGAALLARGEHRRYTLGWIVTAVVVVVAAFVPSPFETRVGVLLVLGPPAGGLVHGRGCARPRLGGAGGVVPGGRGGLVGARRRAGRPRRRSAREGRTPPIHAGVDRHGGRRRRRGVRAVAVRDACGRHARSGSARGRHRSRAGTAPIRRRRTARVVMRRATSH
ncbi:hypothetical protein [Microbacterium gorillae]|uniref:hypothetical protein n=1 Tax=Microbacterium gorillae TaxID=1231063 RepID=UPI00058E476B|nr:hypothetical protein [Microbacterium gorillae]